MIHLPPLGKTKPNKQVKSEMQKKKELADANGVLPDPCEVHGLYLSLFYKKF